MDAIEFLLSNRTSFLASVFLLGLMVGSFLNVVIYRLPIMLDKSWRRECQEFLGLVDDKIEVEERFDLIFPCSRCPHCGHGILAHENIPILSYIFLGGKCVQCKSPISMRYPLVELATALISLAVAWKLGASAQTFWALLLSWALFCLAAIDFDRYLLPDAIVLPFLWLGLLLSLFGVFTDNRSAIIGAMVGYLSLWSVYHVFKLLTGKEGMGYGDFKLLALFGAWLGWQSLFSVVLLSSLVGAMTGILMILLFKRDKALPMPFGPFLCAAGWVSLLWGHEITDYYLRLAGTL